MHDDLECIYVRARSIQYVRHPSRPNVTVVGLPLPLFALQPPAAIEHATARRRVAGLLVRVVSTQHSLTTYSTLTHWLLSYFT